MKLSLVVLTPGKQEGKAIPITLAQFLIGRDPQCQLRPASPAISKRHCAVLVKGGKVYVRDFDSTNGTFVNDVKVQGEVEIKNGDKLKAGPLLFEMKIEVTAPLAKTPAPATIKAPPLAAAAGKADDDDSIAAMLLSLQDDDSGGRAPGDPIPEGSTVMDIAIPTGTDPNVPLPDGEAKPGADKMSQVKQSQASTSSAAKAILEKYMKRPR